MTGEGGATLDVGTLSDDELAAAMVAGVRGWSWHEQAAVRLIMSQRSWLYRWGFRQVVEVDYDTDGQLCAWVDWSKIETTAPASSGEIRILEIAGSLAGIASPRPLSDLLSNLDDNNLARVLAVIEVAARGTQSASVSGVAQPSARLHVPLPVWMPIVEWAVIAGLVATLVCLEGVRWGV